MLEFISLSSGSCGNCYCLSDGASSILVDAGVSLRRLKKIFMEHSLDLSSLKAVLVTHDHLDHIRHLGSYCKHLKLPVYATAALHDALSAHTFTREYISSCRRVLAEEGPTVIRTGSEQCPEVHHFIVPHDATQTVGFFIRWSGVSFFLMTDAGRVTAEAIEYASVADAVVFESNYDMPMLMSGRYPHELKMRICKGNGHLSNEECAQAVRKFWHPGLKKIFLCHLSENNNTPSLAFEASAAALRAIALDNGLTAKDVSDLQVLPRDRASQRFVISA